MNSISDDKPKTFVKVNNGSWWYNYNIKAVEVTDPETQKTRTEYHFDVVQIWGTPTDDNLKKAVIGAKYTESEEINLQNNFQRYQLDLSDDESFKTDYIAYLKDVDAMKKMVETDLRDHADELK